MNKNLHLGPPKLFIHCALVENYYTEIMEEIFEMVEKSGIKEKIELIIGTVGSTNSHPAWYEKKYNEPNITMGEFHTLGILKNYCEKTSEKTPIGYVHTKGIINGKNNPCISDWRRYMGYFVIEKMINCIEAVSFSYDVVGVDWQTTPNFHFSGNFWWSNSDYIKSLPEINPPTFQVERCPSNRHLAEFWIGCKNPKVKCFHQSGINVYERHLHRYQPENYKKNYLN